MGVNIPLLRSTHRATQPSIRDFPTPLVSCSRTILAQEGEFAIQVPWRGWPQRMSQPGCSVARLGKHRLPVAGAAGVMAALAVLVMIGAGVSTVNAPVPLHAVVHADDTNAVAARTFHLFYRYAYGVTLVSTLMSSSCSCGSVRCSIMLVSISRTWQSGIL